MVDNGVLHCNKRISVLSVPIDCVTMDEAVQRILQLTEQPGLHLVATANAEMGYVG